MIRDFVAQSAHLDPALLERPAVASLIDERIRHHGLAGPAAYLDLLRQSPGEVERLVEEIAVPETWLFRYPESYRFLARSLRALRAGRPATTAIRMLSAGCATGEEPWSMAITAIHAGWPVERITVDAIDRSRRLTTAAARGTFNLRALHHDMPEWAGNWVHVTDDRVHVDATVFQVLRFMHGDLLEESKWAAAPPYDVIFCRNLLIYLSDAAAARLIHRLVDWLTPEGLLFVGHAEMWLAPADVLIPLSSPHTFAWRRAGSLLAGTAAQVDPPQHAGTPSRRDEPGGRTKRARRGRGPLPPGAARTPVAGGQPEVPAVATHAPPSPSPNCPRSTPVPATLSEARMLANRGRLHEALAATKTILAADGPDARLLELIGSLQLALGRFEDARDCFRKVVYFEPNHEEALLQLSIICQRLGDDPQATRYRQRAERAHHADPVGEDSK